MNKIDLGITKKHTGVKRNYHERATEDKYLRCELASNFSKDYFDTPGVCYSGYNYIPGYWKDFANNLIEHYKLKPFDKVCDVGCAKGFLLKELKSSLPDILEFGIDISEYAIDNAHPDIKNNLKIGSSIDLTCYPTQYFDLVFSLNTLHNLGLKDCIKSIQEIERIGKSKYIVVESYRNEKEKQNLLYWQLTCKSFYSVEDWEHLFELAGYTGDYYFIFFE